MTIVIQLRRDQLDYILQFAADLGVREGSHSQGRDLCVTLEERDALLALMADRLQFAGFGHEFVVNNEGRLIESIIDALRTAHKPG